MNDHQDTGAMAQDLGRLRQDEFDQPGVLVDLGRQLAGPRRGLYRGEVDGAALRLGDDLLGDDDDVAVGQPLARRRRGRVDQDSKIGAGLDQG